MNNREIIAALRLENMRLRQRLADLHNFDLKDIRDQIDAVFIEWLPKVRKANREALRPTIDDARAFVGEREPREGGDR